MTPPPERIGPYHVSRELGRGGMGVVYLATDTRLDRQVAIKALPAELASDPARLERFEREARTLAQLNHPNLAGIHGVEQQDGARYLVLEYVEGESLADRLDRGPLPVDEAVEFAIQIAAGVEAAHDAGVIHRDLKPANILIHAVSRKAIRKALPQAACFVVPNVTSLSDYKRLRRTQALNWARITERETISIFIPNDSSPQEMRDCLHEELAQSLGPLNDLYRLSDSVFNDDNVHTVLTGFDMLVLRATYDPALRSGMTRAEVAARLPGILSRINPRGDTLAPNRAARTPRVWIDAIETALGPGTKPAARRKAATEALQVALEPRHHGAVHGIGTRVQRYCHVALGSRNKIN